MLNQNRKFLFVGTVVPEYMCGKSIASSIAGNKFQMNLVRGLEHVTGNDLHVISIRPIAMYPRDKKIVLYPDSCRIGAGIEVDFVPFINLLPIKQLTMAIMIFIYIIRWIWINGDLDKTIIVYNVFSPFVLPVLVAKRVISCKAIAIIADLPHDIYQYRGLRSVLERIDFYIQTKSIERFDAIIPLTRYIAHDFAANAPSLVIEGGVFAGDVLPQNDVSDVADRTRICLYSGALNAINGVDVLLKAFRNIADPYYRLWLFGHGELEQRVREAAEQDMRIVYWGAVPNEEVLRRQRQATVLLNPRPTHRKITRYTFPSKLLEYMLSARPVITTTLAGIPEEYYPYLYLLRDETPTGLAEKIQEICARPPEELAEFGIQARSFVLAQKNWDIQARKIYDFIQNI